MAQEDIEIIKFNEQNENSLEEKVFFAQTEEEKTESENQKHFAEIIKQINDNIVGCDFTICLLSAAVRSYRSDSRVRPFPQCFTLANKEKNFTALKYACDNIPPLKELVSTTQYSLPQETVSLLTWLFHEKLYPYLQYSNNNNLPLKDTTFQPNYIFKVCHSKKSEELWQNRVGNREIFYAYHGSNIDNFYSILKVGLQQHLSSEKVLFGAGIYLSNELSVCMNYAPFGNTWEKSILGNKYSVIALCEVIKDGEKVKCKDTTSNNRSVSSNLTAIPEKYFIVTDSEMVRLRYLLVYKQNIKTAINSFIVKNLFWLVIFFYFLMLMLIGFFNGPTWPKLMNYFKKDEFNM